jgi:hypothetical protein
MFIFRHIQLNVLLTSKDEKKARKFHGRQIYFGGCRRVAAKNRQFRDDFGQNAEREPVQNGLGSRFFFKKSSHCAEVML